MKKKIALFVFVIEPMAEIFWAWLKYQDGKRKGKFEDWTDWGHQTYRDGYIKLYGPKGERNVNVRSS